MADDGFDWREEDSAEEADDSSASDRVERPDGEPTTGDDETGRPRSAAGHGAAGGDAEDVPRDVDAHPGDSPTDEDPADRSARADEADDGTEASHVFGDLVDRIEASSGRVPDAGDLLDLVPSNVTEDDPDAVNHLVERAERDPSSGPRDTSSFEPSGGGVGDGLPDLDSTSAEGPGTTEAGTPSDGPTPGATDDAERNDADPDRPSPSGRTNPFEDLASRVATDAERRSLRDRLGATDSADLGAIPPDATNVLLVSSLDTDAAFELCLSLIGEQPPQRTNLLFVWLTRDAGDRLARLYESYAEPTTSVTVVCRSDIGHQLRANPSIPTGVPGSGLAIERISDPRDLTKLGIAINRVISDWNSPKRPLMCFHSVTDLLQFEDHERVFRFLHVLGGRMNSVGATAYYHLDPSAHDAQTVAMFRNLFDATVDLTGGTTGDE